MRVLLQRVSRARVTVEGRVTGEIGPGLLLLAGIREGDGEDEIAWMARKVVQLRVFADEQGRMNRDIMETGGEILAVSQFTLYGDAGKGNRPSYMEAARPEQAEPLFERFCAMLEEALGAPVPRGVFGAHMRVELVNDGPVTLMLDKAPA